LSDTYVLTAFELSKQMIAKSHEVDEALTELRDSAELYPQAYKVMLRQTSEKFLTAKGSTIRDRESLVNLECEDAIYEEMKWKNLKEVFKKTVDVRMGQLSALQSLSSALREELRLGRTGPQEGP
jgi:hypothetical protein